MTPKEKANELVDRMTFNCNECDNDWNAKQCALIAVDEIIKQTDDEHSEYSTNYWQQVKHEIESL